MTGMGEFGGARARPVRAHGGATLLIVDDSRTELTGMGCRLGGHGYRPVLCDNAPDALELIAGQRFDLVLLDLVMPTMSGIEMLAELCGARETVDLPVIVVSGSGDREGPVRALAAGADDFLVKPFAIEVLVARIVRALDHARRLDELKRFNAALDARIANRAIELGELRGELAAALAEGKRLSRALRQRNAVIERLSAGTSVAG